MGIFSNLLGTLLDTFKIGRGVVNAASLTEDRTFTLPDSGGTILVSGAIGNSVQGYFPLLQLLGVSETAEGLYLRGNGSGTFDWSPITVDDVIGLGPVAEMIVVPIENGGTGDSNAAGARSNLEVPGLNDANTFTATQTIDGGSSDGLLVLKQTGTTDSEWFLRNNQDTGRLTFTDDATGARVPFKFGLNAVNNLLRIGIASTDTVDVAGNLYVTVGALGYATGAGGTVTQATSKSTGVTLNKATGRITMHNATLNAGVAVTFTLTNSAIGVNDQIVLSHAATGTLGNYELDYRCAAGSASIYVRNKTGGNLGEAIVIGFAVIKGAAS